MREKLVLHGKPWVKIPVSGKLRLGRAKTTTL